MSVKIITDSASDLTPSEAEKLGIELLPLSISFGDTTYRDGIDLSRREFYEKLIECDELPKTSQISPYMYETVFEHIKNHGDTAVCITVSSKLSGCFQSANIAAHNFPETIQIVDSENACIGQRVLVELALAYRDQGGSAEQIAGLLNSVKSKIRVIALLDTLEYLKKGGRISKTAALAGSVLSIKPVITIENGEIAVLGKARGSKNGNNLLRTLTAREQIDFTKPIRLAYSGLSAETLVKYIEDSRELYGDHIESLDYACISSAIGTHIGPGAIAAAFFTE